MEQLNAIILDYLKSSSPYHYALMLDGHLGSGKTYYFKKLVKPEIEKEEP
ncbi:MAG: hypothetical protein AAFO07_07660 [Bacteroidota bacterium]